MPKFKLKLSLSLSLALVSALASTIFFFQKTLKYFRFKTYPKREQNAVKRNQNTIRRTDGGSARTAIANPRSPDISWGRQPLEQIAAGPQRRVIISNNIIMTINPYMDGRRAGGVQIAQPDLPWGRQPPGQIATGPRRRARIK